MLPLFPSADATLTCKELQVDGMGNIIVYGSQFNVVTSRPFKVSC
jgi:hypothetical protein